MQLCVCVLFVCLPLCCQAASAQPTLLHVPVPAQASRYDVLAALTDLATSPGSPAAVRDCALRAITVMLTPTPPSTAATAEAVLAAARAHTVALPPQGKAARMVRPGEHPPPAAITGAQGSGPAAGERVRQCIWVCMCANACGCACVPVHVGVRVWVSVCGAA